MHNTSKQLPERLEQKKTCVALLFTCLNVNRLSISCILTVLLLSYLNVEKSSYIWARNLGHNMGGWDVASGSETSCQESNLLLPPVPQKFELKRPRFVVIAVCGGLHLSLRPPFASADKNTPSHPARAPRRSTFQCQSNVERGQVMIGSFTFTAHEIPLCRWKTNKGRKIHTLHPPSSSDDLNRLK